jgi:hypothetical protein
MHPEQRPASIAQFRAELLGSAPLPPSNAVDQLSQTIPPDGSLAAALRDNGILIGFVMGLLLVALLITFWISLPVPLG